MNDENEKGAKDSVTSNSRMKEENVFGPQVGKDKRSLPEDDF